uniref:Uncharacterized protein TCIL3000_11_15050 n=1 Tax=Trypanosoma congolense (strain IL3000) TaxID=1068625 RepID=G0V2W5_TRYCI|nr:unnamed protein product [Trypanosoma congolense IL3000]
MVRLPPLEKGGFPARGRLPGRGRAAPHISPQRKRSRIYWQLLDSPAPLHSGPLGEMVGEVPIGTVIREVQRYRDPFGNWWIASRSVDGPVLWLPFCATQTEGTEDTQPRWCRVYDERAVEEIQSAAANGGKEFDRLTAPPEPIERALPSLNDVRGFIRLFETAWCSVECAAIRPRDWNGEYQQLVEQSLFSEWEVSQQGRVQLQRFLREFKEAAKVAVMHIVADSLPPTDTHVEKHLIRINESAVLCDGLLVRVMFDDVSSERDCECGDHAWQTALQFMHAQQMMALEAPKRLLYTVPTAVVTFCGMRACVFGVPPIETKNIVCLPLQEVEEEQWDVPGVVTARLEDLGAAMGLKKHTLKGEGGRIVEIPITADLAVVKGWDKRLYIVGTHRVFPQPVLVAQPEGTKVPCSKYISGVTLANLRIRPEFLFRWGRPVNPDAFVKNATTPEDDSALIEATEYLRTKLIPSVAAVIGLHEPVTFPQQDVAVCTLCAGIMENELRFVVCRNDKKCCSICSHCYTQRLSESDVPPRDLYSCAVKCRSGFRGPKGLLLEPSITLLFHANGLNLRFLPFVYSAIPECARFAVGHYCEVEMIARTAVRVLRSKLRNISHDIEEVKNATVEFLLALLQSANSTSKHFWARELGPSIEKLYGPLEPFNMGNIDVELLCNRITEISGIVLSDASVQSMCNAEAPFLQLEQFLPIVKTVLPPQVTSREVQEKLHSGILNGLGEMLLFWIGALPADEERKSGRTAPLCEPFYLSERAV